MYPSSRWDRWKTFGVCALNRAFCIIYLVILNITFAEHQWEYSLMEAASLPPALNILKFKRWNIYKRFYWLQLLLRQRWYSRYGAVCHPIQLRCVGQTLHEFCTKFRPCLHWNCVMWRTTYCAQFSCIKWVWHCTDSVRNSNPVHSRTV
jgi:hypothetical protein